MRWLIDKLKCWAGYHEPPLCGGHRAQISYCSSNTRCTTAYCPRCGETVGPSVFDRLCAIQGAKVTVQLPQARLVRESLEG